MGFVRVWKRARGYYGRNVARYVFRRPFVINTRVPFISFTFDDFPRSALYSGGEILRRYGLVGTYHVSLGLSGINEASGPMFVFEDLPTLVERGHELGCHTFSHCHSWHTDAKAFEESIVRNNEALREILPGVELRSFSYPISEPRPLTKARASTHFQSCRAGGQTLNLRRADLNQLSSYFLEKSRHNIQPIKDLIDYNRRSHGWLIFATHDISERPTPYGCTPEVFEEVVRYAASSAARILPVSGALEALRAEALRNDSTKPHLH